MTENEIFYRADSRCGITFQLTYWSTIYVYESTIYVFTQYCPLHCHGSHMGISYILIMSARAKFNNHKLDVMRHCVHCPFPRAMLSLSPLLSCERQTNRMINGLNKTFIIITHIKNMQKKYNFSRQGMTWGNPHHPPGPIPCLLSSRVAIGRASGQGFQFFTHWWLLCKPQQGSKLEIDVRVWEKPLAEKKNSC